MKFENYLTEQSPAVKIVNAMHVYKMAKKVSRLLDVHTDPDIAAEQLSMIPDKILRSVMRKLGIK